MGPQDQPLDGIRPEFKAHVDQMAENAKTMPPPSGHEIINTGRISRGMAPISHADWRASRQRADADNPIADLQQRYAPVDLARVGHEQRMVDAGQMPSQRAPTELGAGHPLGRDPLSNFDQNGRFNAPVTATRPHYDTPSMTTKQLGNAFYGAGNATFGLAKELTGVPGIMRGADRISNAISPEPSLINDPPSAGARALQGVAGAGQIAAGALPGLGAAGNVGIPALRGLAPALASTSSTAARGFGTTMALTAPAYAADSKQSSEQSQAEFIRNHPDVNRARDAMLQAEASAQEAGKPQMSVEDRKGFAAIASEISKKEQQLDEARKLVAANAAKPGPIFTSATQRAAALQAEIGSYKAQLEGFNQRAQPTPDSVKAANDAAAQRRAEHDQAQRAAADEFGATRTFRERDPYYAASMMNAAGLAIPGAVGFGVGRAAAGKQAAVSSRLNSANDALATQRSAASADPTKFGDAANAARTALTARGSVDNAFREPVASDYLKSLVPSPLTMSAAGGAVVMPAAPELFDLAYPTGTRQGDKARSVLSSSDYWLTKGAVGAGGLAAGKLGEVAGKATVRVPQPDRAPTDALRNELGITDGKVPKDLPTALANAESAAIKAGGTVRDTARTVRADGDIGAETSKRAVADALDATSRQSRGLATQQQMNDAFAKHGEALQRMGIDANEKITKAQLDALVKQAQQNGGGGGGGGGGGNNPPPYANYDHATHGAVSRKAINDLLTSFERVPVTRRPAITDQLIDQRVAPALAKSGNAALDPVEYGKRLAATRDLMNNMDQALRGTGAGTISAPQQRANVMSTITGKNNTLALPLTVGVGGSTAALLNSRAGNGDNAFYGDDKPKHHSAAQPRGDNGQWNGPPRQP